MALNGLAIPAVIAAGAAAALVAVSYLVEAARSAPTAPGRLQTCLCATSGWKASDSATSRRAADGRSCYCTRCAPSSTCFRR